MRRALLALLALVVLWPGAPAAAASGPCTQAAALGMPEGDDHDHDDPAPHQGFRCRMRQVAFAPLMEELGGMENAKLGEMDVEADVAAVAVQEPEGGALFFDVSDPANPKFLSRYVHATCALGDNCGAYIDLTADGEMAVLSLQQTDYMPGAGGEEQGSRPGVALIDLSDPKAPRLAQEYDVPSVQGVHTARTHVIPSGPAAGEYVFLIANGFGVDVAKLVDTPLGRRMTFVTRIVVADAGNVFSTHDTFIQTDPFDGKTYLYMAGGFTFGFRVYDVSSPANPVHVASWDLTPECTADWYAHTIDVTHRTGRRILTMPAEAFDFGAQPDCEGVSGMGDRAGPLWIVDATDFSALATPDDDAAATKAKSEASLITTWTNPADRAAGPLTFSPHNQQIVGDRIYLSHYHGGVFVLDASDAFAGRQVRPPEAGWMLPFDQPLRPTLDGGSFSHSRGDFWDMVFYKGYVLAADIKGGFYSLQYDGDAPGIAGGGPGVMGPGCTDRLAPRAVFAAKRTKITRRGLRLRGVATERGCSDEVARVLVSVALERGKKCRFLNARAKLGPRRRCGKPKFLPARGAEAFSLRIKGRMRRGVYRIGVRAIDVAGNVQRKVFYKRVRLR